MTTAKTCLAQKSQPTLLVSVGPDDLVVTACS